MTGSTANFFVTVLAENHTSLMHGWVPAVVQAVSLILLLAAFGRRWRPLSLPLAVMLGAALAGFSRWYVENRGLADDPAPQLLWWWIAGTGAAAAVLMLGWRTARWWRRSVSQMCIRDSS